MGRILRQKGDKKTKEELFGELGELRRQIAELMKSEAERRQTEEALCESEERYHRLFNSINDPVFVHHFTADKMPGLFVEVNDAACRRYGYSRDELLRMRPMDIDAPEGLAVIPDAMQRLVDNGSATWEGMHLTRDGRKIPVEISNVLFKLHGDQMILSVVRDISDRKTAEEDLRSSREFISSILDTVDEGFIVIDRDYRIISANKAYCRQANMAVEEIAGKHCYEISHQSTNPCYETGEECAVRHSFEKGEPHVCLHKHQDKDGHVIYVETKSYPLKDAFGNVTSVIETINNITDKHLLEEQILRTQKLEAVGLLAGGIAHDFNNLLQAVFGSISMAKTFSDNNGKAYQMLEGAERALNLAKKLTKQLLTFSKGGEPVKSVISLPAILQDSVKFALSGSNVKYTFSIDKDLWSVEADEGQISQVIHNIVLNAGDAMPGGGTIRIGARNFLIDKKSVLPLEKGKYVLVSIEDSGIGIPENYITRIFDPYFTTKQKGSGLGLATTFSIIKNHDGLLDVESRPGKGSTFFIYLPAIGTKQVPKKEEGKDILPGKGRILVMDDEEIIKIVVGQMLKSLGYEYDFAENGEQTVEKYTKAMSSGEAFDAVILDLTVRGGLGGKETIEKLLEIDPAVRAIVSSGYSDDPVVSNYEDYGFKDTLSKPYEIETLSSILYSVLYGEIRSSTPQE
jgi:PAS domain S-box-containing protein